jgi:hypothetical protein
MDGPHLERANTKPRSPSGNKRVDLTAQVDDRRWIRIATGPGLARSRSVRLAAAPQVEDGFILALEEPLIRAVAAVRGRLEVAHRKDPI